MRSAGALVVAVPLAFVACGSVYGEEPIAPVSDGGTTLSNLDAAVNGGPCPSNQEIIGSSCALKWFDRSYGRRRRVLITNGTTELPARYTATLDVDHAALVADGDSLPDGNDFRIVRWTGLRYVELDRVTGFDGEFNKPTTKVLFRTASPLAANATSGDEYWVYYSSSSASPPPAIEANVFDLVNGKARQVDAPTKELGGDHISRLFYSIQFRSVSGTDYESWAYEGTNDAAAYGDLQVTNRAGSQLITTRYTDLGTFNTPGGQGTPHSLSGVGAFAVRLEAAEFSSSFLYFGSDEVANPRPGNVAKGNQVRRYYVRQLVTPEPTTSLGEVETVPP
jgi:hypothetical protein